MEASCCSSCRAAKWADTFCVFVFFNFEPDFSPKTQCCATYCLFIPTCTDPVWQQIWPHSLCCSNASQPSSPVVGSACACVRHLFHFTYSKTSFWLTSWRSVWIPVRIVRETSLTHGSVLTASCLFQRRTSHHGHRERPGTLRRSIRSPNYPLTGIWSLW